MGTRQRAELTKERVLPGKFQNKTWEGAEDKGMKTTSMTDQGDLS